jgi:hypothetical protein
MAPQEYVGAQLRPSTVHREPSASATVVGHAASSRGPTPLLEEVVLQPASPLVARMPDTTRAATQFRLGGVGGANW